MADERLKIDPNYAKVVGGVGNTSGEILMLRLVDATKRLMVAIQALDKATDSVLMWANTLKDGTGTNYVPVVNSSGELITDSHSSALIDTPEFFEDTSFVTGDSPVTLDLNAALSRNATQGYVINDGAGNFTVAFSVDGTVFGDAITMKKNEILKFDQLSVDSLRITHSGTDSAYRVSVV